MENKGKENIVTNVDSDNSNLKPRVITAIISGAVAIAGFVGFANLGTVESPTLTSMASMIVGGGGMLTSLYNALKIIDVISEKADEKAKIREANKLAADLIKYNVNSEEYEHYKNAIKATYFTPKDYRYLLDLNITADEYTKLAELGITVEEYSKYKKEKSFKTTPNEYFIKNIDKFNFKKKTVVAASIIAGAGAIGFVCGAIGNMTSPDTGMAITSGVIGLASALPLVTGSSIVVESILTKIGLKKTYNQIMAENGLSTDNYGKTEGREM